MRNSLIMGYNRILIINGFGVKVCISKEELFSECLLKMARQSLFKTIATGERLLQQKRETKLNSEYELGLGGHLQGEGKDRELQREAWLGIKCWEEEELD